MTFTAPHPYTKGVADERQRVRDLIEKDIELIYGGRCVKPDDYDPESLNICVTHSELIFEDGCEDQPRVLLQLLGQLDA